MEIDQNINDDRESKNIQQSNSDNDDSDKGKYRQLKKEVQNKTVKKKKNIGAVLETLLSKKKSSHPILLGKKNAFQKVDDEKVKYIENLEKKKLRIIQKNHGHKKCDEWNFKQEKSLLNTTTKGVVKLFNCIFEFRKKIRDEKIKEDTKKERKSTNFLMMHNLDPTLTQNKLNQNRSKNFKEDDL